MRREQNKERMRGRQLVVRSNDERLDEQMRPPQMANGLVKIGVSDLDDGFRNEPVIAVPRQEDRIIRAWLRRALNCHWHERLSARRDGKQRQWRVVELLRRRKTAIYGSVKHGIIG